ncbi:MAG: efflux RND transporter periplasmic adaptor subunit [Lachnospiraceae bacterium]|nr:efflux RND transporter periplasmic adaptor subunit [Lachnospiraceae bacterium]
MNSAINKKKVTVISLITVAALAVGGISLNASAAIKVNSYTASTGNLSRVTEINGNVVSNKTESYYSLIDGRIAQIAVKEGDFVKKGDLLIAYDTEEIDRMISLTDYSMKETAGNCDNVIQTGGRNAGLYSEAKNNLEVLEQQITDTQAAIDRAQNRLVTKQAQLADFGAKLQISLIDYSDDPTSSDYENLSKMAASNAYAQQYDPEIISLQQELNTLNVQLASYKELKAQMVSQKTSSTMGLITSGAKEQVEATKASSELNGTVAIDKYEEARDGIKAEFDGVVTSIGVIENSTVMTGTPMITIESTKDVVIKMNVNKYDILDMEVGQSASCMIKSKEYTGQVSRIEHMTGNDGTSGIGVEVTLDEPDENIILGLETKVRIDSASLENILIIPLDALCEDEEGEYVFILNDDQADKCFVETGVRNDDEVQIVSGLYEGDTVIWNDETELTDGQDVKIIK